MDTKSIYKALIENEESRAKFLAYFYGPNRDGQKDREWLKTLKVGEEGDSSEGSLTREDLEEFIKEESERILLLEFKGEDYGCLAYSPSGVISQLGGVFLSYCGEGDLFFSASKAEAIASVAGYYQQWDVYGDYLEVDPD